MYGMNTPAQFTECISSLERSGTRLVLSDQLFTGENMKAVFPGYVPPTAQRLIMEPYLETHYRVIGTVGRFRILGRR
jgi:hypothetical protein